MCTLFLSLSLSLSSVVWVILNFLMCVDDCELCIS